MYDNYNYPPGTDTPNAPWNQPDTPMTEITVSADVTLTKAVNAWTTDYIPGHSECELEYDPDSDTAVKTFIRTGDDFSETNLRALFTEASKSPIELINELADTKRQLVDYYKKMLINCTSDAKRNDCQMKIADAERWIQECDGWIETDTIYEHDC